MKLYKIEVVFSTFTKKDFPRFVRYPMRSQAGLKLTWTGIFHMIHIWYIDDPCIRIHWISVGIVSKHLDSTYIGHKTLDTRTGSRAWSSLETRGVLPWKNVPIHPPHISERRQCKS